MHEAIEAMLARMTVLRREDVDRFDMTYEGEGESGEEPDAHTTGNT